MLSFELLYNPSDYFYLLSISSNDRVTQKDKAAAEFVVYILLKNWIAIVKGKHMTPHKWYGNFVFGGILNVNLLLGYTVGTVEKSK